MAEVRIRFDVFTLFPGMFAGPLDESILKRARAAGLVETFVHDIRRWTADRHRTADDSPFGGGAGMVMIAPPIVAGVEETLADERDIARILLMAAGGRPFTQAMARDLAGSRRIALICGHYEGIDQRVVEVLGAEEVSIGDYVLTGGELPAMVVIDAVARLVPGVIDAASIEDESHGAGTVEYPHYTRPRVFRGIGVPEVLLGGNHAEIARWRREQAAERTGRLRPDLLAAAAPADARAASRDPDSVTPLAPDDAPPSEADSVPGKPENRDRQAPDGC
jgi:tRNA (guanine37-N1)-methyltransferase